MVVSAWMNLPNSGSKYLALDIAPAATREQRFSGFAIAHALTPVHRNRQAKSKMRPAFNTGAFYRKNPYG